MVLPLQLNAWAALYVVRVHYSMRFLQPLEAGKTRRAVNLIF